MSRERILNIQSLRFFFIMLVVFSHISYNTTSLGACGVCFFFVLSGFILSWAYGERIALNSFSTPRFLAHQMVKMYPLYVVMIVVMAVYFHCVGIYDVSLKDFAVNLFLLQTWFPHSVRPFVIDSPTWFLCDIVVCYICFRTLYRTIMLSGRRRLLVLSAIVLAAYSSAVTFMPECNEGDLYDFPVFRLVDFSMGIILFRFYVSGKGRALSERTLALSAGMGNSICAAFLIVLAVMFYFFIFNNKSAFRYGCLFLPYMLALIFWFASTDKRNDLFVNKILHKPWMLSLGGLTMEMFIIHMFVCFVVYDFSVQVLRIERTLGVKLCEKVAIILLTLLLSMIAKVALKKWSGWIGKRRIYKL